MAFEFPPRQSPLVEEAGAKVAGVEAGKFVTRHWLDWFTKVRNIVAMIYMGNGNPNGVVGAPVGSLYLQLDGAAGTTLWVKEAGTGTAGWVGK